MPRKDSTVIQTYVHETERILLELGVGDGIRNNCIKSTLFSSILPPPTKKGNKTTCRKELTF